MKTHIDYLKDVADQDVMSIREAEKNYGSSWKKRGGVGAFMMLARKWDRLENALKPNDKTGYSASAYNSRCVPWDILEALNIDDRPEGIIDDIRDLRCYLLLVEAEYMASQQKSAQEIMREDLSKGGLSESFETIVHKHFNINTGKEKMSDRRVPRFDEPTNPGTPEDGGHHEKDNVDLVIISENWYRNDLTDQSRKAYEKIADKKYRLKEQIDDDTAHYCSQITKKYYFYLGENIWQLNTDCLDESERKFYKDA